MLTLLILRHGKSNWGADFRQDHERPLAKRGHKAVKLVGDFLSRIGLIPDSVVSSSAVRAKTTVELALDSGGWTCPIRVTDKLYDAVPGLMIEEIRAEPSETKTLLIAGHEPTCSTLTSLLVGGGSARFPTAALACIEFPFDAWAGVAPSSGRLAWLVNPRLLERAGTRS